jgi:hypothetical protein
MDAARTASLAGDYEKSDTILKSFRPTPNNYDEYHYYSLINHFKLNQKEAAGKDLVALERSFTHLPRRHEALVGLMRADLKTWTDGDMKDISRDMTNSSDRLLLSKAGAETQRVQKDIIDKLDTLIKESEDKANASAKAPAGGEGDKMKLIPGSQSGPGGMNQPAPDSTIMGGAGAGKVDDRKLRQAAENWGTLPPDRREALVQELTRDLPARYKPMIDEYFRSLNRIHRP